MLDERIVIAGLGNPGNQLIETRHNVGFLAIDMLFLLLSSGRQELWNKVEGCCVCNFIIRDTHKLCVLIKPYTSMNTSGQSMKALFSKVGFKLSNTLVLHDDLEVKLGLWKVQNGGSASGHNGIRNIMHHFGNTNFLRIKIGIGRPTDHMAISQYVLSPFNAEAQLKIKECLDQICSWIYDQNVC